MNTLICPICGCSLVRLGIPIAVRDNLEVAKFGQDLDADDDDFLFSGFANNLFFPKRRDVLVVDVGVPSENLTFTVMVVHTKARFGGRTTTEPRRIGSSVAIVQRLEQEFDGKRVILLGDFNDTPDDRSLNILESGDASIGPGADSNQGPFLINLTEELYDIGHVTFGRNTSDIMGDSVVTIDVDARTRNLTNLGNDKHTGDQMFDQLLQRVAPPAPFQSSRLVPPAAMAEGSAVSVVVTAGPTVIVTEASAWAPPRPSQVR